MLAAIVEYYKVRDGDKITSETGAGLLFIFKAYKQAHSGLCNCLFNAGDGQKDKPVSDVIKFTFLRVMFVSILILMGWPSVGNAQWLPGCADESEIAAIKVQQIINEWPIRKSDGVTLYVRRLGDRLARYAAARDWHFNVVRDRYPNAFAVGGGYIFITEGAITICQSEAELAAILAHEIGHQIAGHFCHNDQLFRPGEQFIDFESNLPGTIRKKSIGSLTQVIDIQKEIQADRIAVQLLSSAGYDAYAMLEIARRLPLHDTSFDQSDKVKRISSLRKLLANVPRIQSSNTEQFRKMKQQLR
jgi:beta-barrel assembly-enhancing protease